MKRTQDKIKDFVDARPYEPIKNFLADPAQTVAAYRYTDVTADLMAKWFNEINEIARTHQGAARALAGNRGVGKSHFLGVVGALVSHPELRSRLADAHVLTSVGRLPRRKLTVVVVERGLADNLNDEMRTALNRTFGEHSGEQWGDTPAQMLLRAAELNIRNGAEQPLIVLIDSAFERAARVNRDDGALLAEMAEVTARKTIFLAVALDDDIAGADGVNVAIARSYAIEYLDPEHLYRVVDAYLYPKRATARINLHELYQGLRDTVPGFNWSEPRFAALYPIHPVVVDVTPAVRLYARRFAFLPFAAESGARIMARPAHSLVALDEVFDRVETDLRRSPELEDAFQIYDLLATKAISQIPLMQRLQAKLVLKGLLILSLDGRGTTARELAAAMLIYDENNPQSAILRVMELLERFAAAAPAGKVRTTVEGDETRYRLDIGHSFEERLTDATKNVTTEEIERALQTVASARFPDFAAAEQTGENAVAGTSVASEIVWRGGLRRGQVVWSDVFGNGLLENTASANGDWTVAIVPAFSNSSEAEYLSRTANLDDKLFVVWQPAALKPEEAEVVRRLAVLQSSVEILDEFGEIAVAAEQTFISLVERIWTGAFLDNGTLWVVGEQVELPRAARNAATLREMLESCLAPLFAEQYPAHPEFAELLGTFETAQIVGELFGGGDPNAAHVQNLAGLFAEPLQLVTKRGEHYLLESDDRILRLPTVQIILALLEAAGDAAVVSLEDIYTELEAAPWGLSRDAAHLILGALVARRRIELVTASSERIGRRSLGLQIAWANIIGIARGGVVVRDNAELIRWATLLTGVHSFESLDAPEDRARIRAAFEKWLHEWQTAGVLQRFSELPDDLLNLRVWRLATRVERSFGAVADALEAVTNGELPIEDGLERVIEAFYETPEQVAAGLEELEALKTFVAAAPVRERVWQYTAEAELTEDERIEELRQTLQNSLQNEATLFDSFAFAEFERVWHEFHYYYREFYTTRHDAALRSSRPSMLEELYASAEWSEFVGLAALPLVQGNWWEQATTQQRRAQNADCNFDARSWVEHKSRCVCGFRVSTSEQLERLPGELARTVNQGRAAYRRTLALLGSSLTVALEAIASSEPRPDLAYRAETLAELLKRGEELPLLREMDLLILRRAAGQLPESTLRVKLPRSIETGTSDEVRTRFNEWLDCLPSAPVGIRIVNEMIG